MNTASSSVFSPNCSQPSAASRAFPPMRHPPQAFRSRLSTVDSRLPSNRQIPELESLVSHRKQTIGPLSNRHKFAFCNFHLLRASVSSPTRSVGTQGSRCCLFSPLATSLPRRSPLRRAKAGHPYLSFLIANDMHSREESSACKQSNYQILIANEIQCVALTPSALEGHRPPQQRAVALSSASSASFASSISRISNRQIPELESPVSHRKQTIGPLSNRHKFAFCNFRPLLIPTSLPPCLFASSCQRPLPSETFWRIFSFHPQRGRRP